MSSYSLLLYSVAATALAMGTIHLLLWLAVRREIAQLWVALCFACFAVVTAGHAGAGQRTSDPGAFPWLLAMVPTSVFHPFMVFAIWHLFERPMSGMRRTGGWILLGVAALVITDRLLAALGITRTPASTEEFLWGGPMAPVSLGLLLAPLAIFVGESIEAFRRHSGMALTAGLTAAASGIALLAIIATNSFEYVMFAGLPFFLFASATVVTGYIRNARRADFAGEYRLERRIASGGMGELFLAHKTGPGGFSREVALKRIRPEMLGDAEKLAEFEARFLAEARLAASLSHPNVIAVYDLGRLDEGGWFLAMEFLHGSSVAEVRNALFARGALAPAEAIAAIGEQLCRGLGAAHAAGIVHRDVSPHNVMITKDGVVKIVDFGIAKPVAQAEIAAVPSPGASPSSELTLPGKVLGKLGYLAPEQIEGKPASPASDIYAMGVVLFEIATGARPYRKPGDLDSLPRRGEWRPARFFAPSLPEPLDHALTAALAWEAAARPAAAVLAESFRRISGTLPYADLGGWLRPLASETEPTSRLEAGGDAQTDTHSPTRQTPHKPA